MKFEKEGEWEVSTPVCIGDAVAVARMATCAHTWTTLVASRRVERAKGNPDMEMFMERCLCGASRAKSRKVKNADVEGASGAGGKAVGG